MATQTKMSGLGLRVGLSAFQNGIQDGALMRAVAVVLSIQMIGVIFSSPRACAGQGAHGFATRPAALSC